MPGERVGQEAREGPRERLGSPGAGPPRRARWERRPDSPRPGEAGPPPFPRSGLTAPSTSSEASRHFRSSRPSPPPWAWVARAEPRAGCGRAQGGGGCCSGCRPWPRCPRAPCTARRRRRRCQVTWAPGGGGGALPPLPGFGVTRGGGLLPCRSRPALRLLGLPWPLCWHLAILRF